MLQQKLSQKMVHKLSPQQIQLIKLLQVPTAQLDLRIQEELESNPALEIAESGQEEPEESFERVEEAPVPETEEPEYAKEEFDVDEYVQDYIEDDPGSYQMRIEEASLEDENRTMPIKVEMTFYDYLMQQLGMLDLKDPRKIKIAEQIIGSIDEDGYLRRDPEAIVDDLAFSMGITATEEEVADLLERIRRFDPPGVASKDLRDCLLLQLEDRIKNKEEADEALLVAHKLIDRYFDAFSKKHFDKLKRQLNLTDDELRAAIQEILKLNPKPASGFLKSSTSSSANMYIIPDFIITNREGNLELTLNNKNAPELRINDKYKNIVNNYNDKKKSGKPSKKDQEALMFVKTKIDSAKWFIDAIKQRQQTLYRTMYAILQNQKEYFLTGDESKIKPMILKDIAELTGLDVSTISRVANSKYVQTEFGTKLLKDFFSESVIKEDGEEVSTLEVKKALTNIIANEDKRKPLSDEKLKEELLKKGYNIARRTIAKYRESLNIPVARLRREI